MDQELKDSLACTFALCDEVEKVLGETIALQYPLKKLLQTELMVFIMYLSLSDMQIDSAERQFLSEYLGFEFASEEIEKFMVNNDLADFNNTIPYTFQLFVQADNAFYRAEPHKLPLAATALYEMYENIGMALITSDGEIDIQEYEDLFSYLKMLSQYMSSELDFRKEMRK